jgi:hypothetical protein
MRTLLSFLLCAAIPTGIAQASLQITPTTTLAKETANNTSASNSYNLTSTGNAAPGNVSKLPMRNLLYGGSTTHIYAQLQGWFGNTTHINVGYISDDPAQVARQVNDAISRGFDGFIVDWYGEIPDPRTNHTAQLLRAEAEKHPGFTFAIQEDVGALWQCFNTPGCSVTNRLTDDLKYIYYNYMGSSAYMRIGGRPVVFLFDETIITSIDWSYVHANMLGNPLLIDRHRPDFNAFTFQYYDGGFAWPFVNLSNTLDWGQAYLADFYTQAKSYPTKHAVGSTYKGFNDNLASWTLHRVIDQQCGAVWMNTWNLANANYNSSSQLEAIQVSTWNDYEEGSEIETGISNCLTVNASLSGAALNFSPSGSGNENLTVDHYTAFISTDGQNLMKLTDAAPGIRSLNLASYALAPGTYYLYVKMQAKPGFLNRMSAVVSYTVGSTTANKVTITSPVSGTSVASPIQVVASATAAALPIKVMQIYLDGVKKYEVLNTASINTSVAAATGLHTLVAQAYDANYKYFYSTVQVTVTTSATSNKVSITSPVNNSTVANPVHVVASATATALPIKVMQIYVDGVKAAEVLSVSNIDKYLTLSRTRWHTIVVQAYDANWKYFNSSVKVYVP